MIWDEVADRLKAAFEATKAEKGWSWPRLAKEMSTTKTTLANWISGDHFPSRANWRKIERVTGRTVEEFLLGEGRAAKVHQLRDQVCQNPEEVQLLHAYRDCNPVGKAHIATQAEFALQKYPQDANVKQFPPGHKPIGTRR